MCKYVCGVRVAIIRTVREEETVVVVVEGMAGAVAVDAVRAEAAEAATAVGVAAAVEAVVMAAVETAAEGEERVDSEAVSGGWADSEEAAGVAESAP